MHAHAHLARTVSAVKERLETSPANAVAVSRTPAVDPRPFVAELARVEPPERVGIGSEGEHGVRVAALSGALQQLRIRLYACGDAANGCIRPKGRCEREAGAVRWRPECEVVMESKR